VDKLKITGGQRLNGTLPIRGAKNAALPAMAASLLTAEPVELQNIPLVRDIQTTSRLLGELGVAVNVSDDHTASLCAAAVKSCEAPYELVKTMRSSVLVLGPLLARFGHARVSLPGGCAIGARPIDQHIKGLRNMGAEVSTEHGYVEAVANRLKGSDILFDCVTVTGTENLMMAAVLAEGTTTLRNAACEPEVEDLGRLLVAMGARVRGAGTSTVSIEGVPRLKGARHKIIPDRIETGTFLIAGAITAGTLELTGTDGALVESTLEKLRRTGARVEAGRDCIRICGVPTPTAVDVETGEYPGFPTDMQAQYMALMTQAAGASRITENIFENRFMHASELIRMGANIKIEGARAIVAGPTQLSGANVIASDLRASASLVLAGLVADGETVIDRVYHLDRGYERIEERLRGAGALIERLR
jgi:UDP-N-acetylglucosamine 1-carboxyvinyltransferase